MKKPIFTLLLTCLSLITLQSFGEERFELTSTKGEDICKVLLGDGQISLVKITDIGPLSRNPRDTDETYQEVSFTSDKTLYKGNPTYALGGSAKYYQTPSIKKTPEGPWQSWNGIKPAVGEQLILGGFGSKSITFIATTSDDSEMRVQRVINHFSVAGEKWTEPTIKALLDENKVLDFEIGYLLFYANRSSDFSRDYQVLFCLLPVVHEPSLLGKLLRYFQRVAVAVPSFKPNLDEYIINSIINSKNTDVEPVLVDAFVQIVAGGSSNVSAAIPAQSKAALREHLLKSKRWQSQSEAFPDKYKSIENALK